MDVSNLKVNDYGFINEPDERDSHGDLISWPGQRRPVKIRGIDRENGTLLVKIYAIGRCSYTIPISDFMPDPLFYDGTVQDW